MHPSMGIRLSAEKSQEWALISHGVVKFDEAGTLLHIGRKGKTLRNGRELIK